MLTRPRFRQRVGILVLRWDVVIIREFMSHSHPLLHGHARCLVVCLVHVVLVLCLLLLVLHVCLLCELALMLMLLHLHVGCGGGVPKVGFPVQPKICALSQRWRQG